MSEILATADLHLDQHAWADRPQIRGDSEFGFKELHRAWCHNQRFAAIIAAGDLIDKQKNVSETAGFIRRMMDRFADPGIPFLYVQGQHELQPVPWLSEIHEHPIWLDGYCREHKKPYKLPDGTKIWGLDWTPRDKLAARLKEVPRDTDILVMHQVCQEFMGSVVTPEFSLAQVPYAKMLIMGDYHKHMCIKHRGMQGQEVTIYSPGSTNMRSIDEPPQKYIFSIDTKTCKSLSLKLYSRPVVVSELLVPEQVDEFVSTIANRLAQSVYQAQPVTNSYQLPDRLIVPLCWVKYRVDIEDAYERISKAVGDKAHLFTKEILPPREETAEEEMASEEREQIRELGLLGCLPRVVDQSEKPEVFGIARRLLESSTPEKELATLRAEYGV